jgi:hypothetical protein
MKRQEWAPVLAAMFFLLWVGAAWARPLPRHVGDPLLDALLDGAAWSSGRFEGRWLPETSGSRLHFRLLAEKQQALGFDVQAVEILYYDDQPLGIGVVFLDAGNYFGFDPGGDLSGPRGDGASPASGLEARKIDFRALYGALSRELPERLEAYTGAQPKKTKLGKQNALATPVLDYPCANFVLRLQDRRDQLVRLTILHATDATDTFLDPAMAMLDRKHREKSFRANLRPPAPNGDVLIDNVPVVPQGWRAYCAMSTFAMVGQYLGVRISPDELAAAAGFRYGQARSAHILDVYGAVCREAGAEMSRTAKFEFDRACKTIDSGFPVLVWRRFSPQRDYLHTTFARQLAGDPSLTLPAVDPEEKESWPDAEGEFNHASVVNGYNAGRGEVIFSESWGEGFRNRRMRKEELEQTSYKAFYFGF